MGVSSHFLLFVFIWIKISRHWVGKYFWQIFFILHLLPLPRLLPPPPLLPRHLKIRMLVKKTQIFFYKVTCDRCFLLDHWNLLSLKIFKNKYFFNIFLINDIFQIYITSIFKSLLVKEKSSGNICWVCHSRELSSYTTAACPHGGQTRLVGFY